MKVSLRTTTTVLLLLAATWAGTVWATEPPAQGRLEIGPPVTPFVFDGDVRNLPPVLQWRPGDPIKEIPRRYYPKPGHGAAPGEPSVATRDLLADEQRFAPDNTTLAFTTPSRNFAGQPYSGVNPPDTAGDVGPSHYIQMINAGGGATVRIYDKAEPTPNAIATFSLDSLGSGNCATGFGDPIVIYDRPADRWMLTEFSSSGNRLCVYISQTSDPVTGGWYNYGYQAPSFPDYPKYGVWPTDANGGQGSYVVTANDGGPGVYALDRGAMLAGSPGTYQRITIPGLPGFGFEAPTPPDLDGPTPPPTGSPAIVMRHRDTESHSGPAAPADLLELWAFDIDWVTPSNTTLDQLPSIDVAEFDSATCGLTSFFCFPQPSGPTLDPLREVVMNRLQYFNHGDYETLVGNFVIDVDGNDLGGIRWFELRREGLAWTLYQEGTYTIDSTHRWMGASSMDQSGNIALAYSVSSNSVFPGLRYTGRLATDPLSVMTQAETTIHAGTASNSSNRWGDYAAMNLDPTDDCTFWFTSLDNTSSNWRTQIASFAFDACGCELAPSPSTASAVVVGDNRIDVSWDDADLAEVIEYRVRRSTGRGGPYSTIATIPDSSQGSAGGAGYVYQDTDVSGGTIYYYTIVSSDGVACTSDVSNEASASATGACTLAPNFAGLVSVGSPYTETCALDLDWSAATANCGGPVSYSVYRSPNEGGTPSLLLSGVTATSYSDLSGLDSDEDYFYIVRAVDQSNGIDDGNTIEVGGVPQGTLTTGTWRDDAGDNDVAKMEFDGTWGINASQGTAGSAVYKTGTYNSNVCAGLVTPELQLGTGSMLSFSSRYDIENSWDKGEVQISTDGGGNWQRVPVSYPGNSTNTSDNCGLPTGSYFTGTNNSFQSYSASLSSWNGQTVLLRFVLSTDSSVVGNGWWIDDIEITEVDVPSACTTGSACVDNPFVNVLPDGPIEKCVGDVQQFTASLTGGDGPFSYQWMRDGVPIDGATDSTLDVNDSGTHDYNVIVTADSCEEGATDGASTLGNWVDAPSFGGIVSASNAQLSTCTVNLDWDAATSVCPGPVTYDVYRSTSATVDPLPGNLIASGLSVTEYSDAVGLISGESYNYLVRAFDQSTGTPDTNTVQAAGAATAAGGGLQTLFSEVFDNPFIFGTWNVTTGPGPHTCGAWTVSHGANPRPADADGQYALADSNACGSGSQTSTRIETPVIDGDIAGITSATLDLKMFYNHLNGDDASIEVWDGSGWQTLWTDSNSDFNLGQTWDVTSALSGNSDFRIGFDYQNAANDAWFSFDDVEVTVDVTSVCETGSGSIAPPPAPDGSNGTTPLGASRVTASGDALEVSWDVSSCLATDYSLLYGTLANVANYGLDGSVCAVGTSGALSWTGVPPGSLYFLIVGNDGGASESSWGTDSTHNERGGAAASGECSVALKDISAVCP